MTNRETGDPDDRTPEEAALSARLRHLGERLGPLRPNPASERAATSTAAHNASAYGSAPFGRPLRPSVRHLHRPRTTLRRWHVACGSQASWWQASSWAA